jgi:hypothetical protein
MNPIRKLRSKLQRSVTRARQGFTEGARELLTWQEFAAEGSPDADVDNLIDPEAAEPARQWPPARLSDSYAA